MLFSAPMVPARHLGARRRLVIPSASEGLAQAVLITQATLCDRVATDDEEPHPVRARVTQSSSCDQDSVGEVPHLRSG